MARHTLRMMFRETLANWEELSGYQRFEQIVAVLLTVMISAVVVFAMFYLVWNVFTLLVVRALDPFDYRVFQAVFEMILVVLIAMEFNNSIVRAMARRASIIQVKTVLLIAILALVRKFIILETDAIDAWVVVSLSLALLAVGVVYWLMRERDDRLEASQLSRREKEARKGTI